MSTFGGIEMGKQAINAFRLGMQTVGHNVSNMNTEGYSRQRVIYKTVEPMNIPNTGQLGQGMSISEIKRIRDEFLDFQFRNVQCELGYYEKLNDLYTQIQNYITEPASSSIRTAMDNFFEDMQTVQQSPEDISARRSLVTSANTLGGVLGNLADNLEKYNDSVNLEIQQSVDDANSMLYEIAALNKEIYHAESLGQNANDLRDQRDLIVDKLSKMMDIEYNEPMTNGTVTGEFFLTLNGRTLVQGQAVRELRAHAFTWNNKTYYDVQVAQNEFHIVDNTAVTDALATGAEGSYMLAVDRIANGNSWTIGGGDAYCLETREVVTPAFEDGITSIQAKETRYDISRNDLDSIDGNSPTSISTYFQTMRPYTNRICIVDTPGVNSAINMSHGDLTRNALKHESFDMIVYVFHAGGLGRDEEHQYLKYLSYNALFIALYIICACSVFVTASIG